MFGFSFHGIGPPNFPPLGRSVPLCASSLAPSNISVTDVSESETSLRKESTPIPGPNRLLFKFTLAPCSEPCFGN